MVDAKLATDLYIKAKHFRAIRSHAEVGKVVLFPSGKRLRIAQHPAYGWYLADERHGKVGHFCRGADDLEALIDNLSHQEGYAS